ncbi:MAG: hypothetical protein E6G94_15600 [Alphaproteobacteria bacterium]|nr:MAG: hypothetical protein E6G94_15600 [Alphaproteobacteria bacterium]
MPSNLDWPLALILALVGIPILGAIFYMLGESIWAEPRHFLKWLCFYVGAIIVGELVKRLRRKFPRKPAQAD